VKVPALVAGITALALVSGAAAPAAGQTTAPILRVETGMHTTLIRRVVVDAARNRLITASDDKTIRVWQMPEARLLGVLRVPMDEAHEGQLFGLAVSPDGKMVAAAGWTGWDWEGQGSIYIFDVATGELVKRIGGLPSGPFGSREPVGDTSDTRWSCPAWARADRGTQAYEGT
jgi:WD40 repeat protein